MSNTASLIVTLPGGRRVDALVGRHVVHTDQPADLGGADADPSPFDLFLASMGTCAGIFVQGFCAKRGIPFEEIRILERLSYGDDGVLASVDLDLQLPATFPDKYRDALVKVVEQCSVKRAIRAQPAFTVHAEPPAHAVPAETPPRGM
jgi:ribosomal protein S12 methylthiotransferase accessory factor